jgi:hypothetical protein
MRQACQHRQPIAVPSHLEYGANSVLSDQVTSFYVAEYPSTSDLLPHPPGQISPSTFGASNVTCAGYSHCFSGATPGPPSGLPYFGADSLGMDPGARFVTSHYTPASAVDKYGAYVPSLSVAPTASMAHWDNSDTSPHQSTSSSIHSFQVALSTFVSLDNAGQYSLTDRSTPGSTIGSISSQPILPRSSHVSTVRVRPLFEATQITQHTNG